jgi:hypothetical protein
MSPLGSLLAAVCDAVEVAADVEVADSTIDGAEEGNPLLHADVSSPASSRPAPAVHFMEG